MRQLSRRSLARWAASQINAGIPQAEIVKSLSAVLIASRRENQAGMLALDIAYELERGGDLSSATVTTRYPLNDEIRRNLEQHIADATNTEKVQLNELIDTSVIGGIRIATATRSWDFTVANQLNELRKVL